MNKVLVVVDMQNDFVTGPLGTQEARAIVDYVRNKVDMAHYNDTQVIFTRDTHQEDYLETQEGRLLPIRHCIEGTPGHDIVPQIAELIDINDDIVLNKDTFGCLDLIDEIDYLEEAIGEIDEIELVGLCTGICVIANAVICKTGFVDTTITIDTAGCACVNVASHNVAVEAMKLLQMNIIGG